MGSQHRVRTMLRLPIFSENEEGRNTLLEVFKKWAGDFEIRFTGDRTTYWAETPLQDNPVITQYTSLHLDSSHHPRVNGIENAPGEEQFAALLVFGLGCADGNLELPKKLHEYFLPQKLLVDLSETGSFNLVGTELISTPIEVGFDQVSQWWDETKVKSVNLPQVIIGKSKNSPLPVLNPETLAKILAGIAQVYFASTPSVMEAMNHEMAAEQIPSGSIRIIGASEVNSSVVYTPRRMKEIETKFGRSVILDIFIRLSLNGLSKNEISFDEWGMLKEKSSELSPYNIQSTDDPEAIKDLNHLVDFKESQIQEMQEIIDSLEAEKEKQESKTFSLEQDSETLTSRVQELTSQADDYKRMIKQTKKDLKKAERANQVILQELREMISDNKIKSKEELFEFLRARPTEKEENEIFEEYNPTTLVEVLKRSKTEHHDKITIMESAIKSARQSTFNSPIRVWEIILALVEKYDHILQRSSQNQSINLQETLRKTAAAGVLDISNKESKPTMDRYGDQRKFRHGNRDFELQTHIKIGTKHDQSKTLRVHFGFDKKTNKFIIGHCGKHLDTVSSN